MKMSTLEYISYALFPRRCALCGKVVPPDLPVCEKCEAHLEYVKGELCPHCGREYKTEKGLADHIAKEHADAPAPGEE